MIQSLKSILVASFLAIPLAACRPSAPPALGFQIAATHPHDVTSFTQGLQLLNGRLFESSGMYGESALREIDPATGKVLRQRPLAKNVFGEGMTVLNNEMWVLTWKENTVFVFNPDTFAPLRSFHYEGEGWGLTDDGMHLIMSDGSANLTFRDPKDFSIIRTITVKDGNQPVTALNELEWVNGQIFANVFETERIVRISPDSGQVTGWLDLRGLRNQLAQEKRPDVLNGIAWNPKTGNLLVTGKYWSTLFELKIIEK